MNIKKLMGVAFVVGTLSTIAVSPLVAAQTEQGKKNYEEYTFPYGDTIRSYSMYIPDSLAPGKPVVFMTHGYNSQTRRRKDLNKAAKKYGFAVCYPNGSPDSKGKDGWDVGYPSQYSMTVNEADWFARFVPAVAEKFNLSTDNVFLAGMSNGGDLCYQILYQRPQVFKAYASVAGLTFECVYDSLSLSVPRPFMEIHGNHDTTSAWQGDHANKGGWGAYIPTPLAVSAIAANNKCRSMVCDTLVSLSRPEASVYHTVYTDSPYGADVEVYEIEGGKHSWGHKDVPTADIIVRFFSKYVER